MTKIMIDGKRLLTWLKRERDQLELDRNNQSEEMSSAVVGGLIELCYVIDHVEHMVNKGGTNGKKD